MSKKIVKQKKKKHFIANEDQTRKIIDMGAFEYPAKKMALVLCLDSAQRLLFLDTIADTSSEIYKAAAMGKSQIDYAIDSKLLAMIHSGDLNALEEFELRKHDRKNT